EYLDRIVEKGDKVSGSGTSAVYEYTVYGNKQQYQMDIVPYVYEVVTGLSSLKTKNPTVYTRNSLGHYSVRAAVTNSNKSTADNETITLKGWNLNGTTVAVTNGTSVNKEDGKITFTTETLQTASLTATVNSIPLMNNINNNDAMGDCASSDSESGAYQNCYNRTPNGDNNNLLTDDIYFDVWEINNRVAEPSNQSIGGTKMQVNSTNGLIQYAYSDGTYFVMGNTPSTGNANQKATSGTQWAQGWDIVQEPSVGFMVDANGYTVGTGHPSDTDEGNCPDTYCIMSSKWGFGFTDGNGGFRQFVTNMKILETTVEKTNNVTTNHRQKIKSSALASSSANVYLAYYDAMNKEIRFRAGAMAANDGNVTSGDADPNWASKSGWMTRSSYTSFGMFDANSSTGNGLSALSYDQSRGNSQTIAGKNTGRGTSEYVSIAVSQNSSNQDVVSAVWLDATTGTPSLKYSYIEDPVGNIDTIKKDQTAKNWNTPKTIFSNFGGGEHCVIASDKNGGIHIAAYAGNGYLYYAYAKSYDSDFIECCIDATDGVGQYVTLDVALNSAGNPIPYIGYYSTAGKPKYAFLTDDVAAEIKEATDLSGLDINGVDSSNAYNGKWNVSVVPTKDGLSLKPGDKINVGVWKATNGTLKYSTTDGNAPGSTNIGTSTFGSSTYEIRCDSGGNRTSTRNESVAYGNGTKNGVLVYQIVDSTGNKYNCLESAQMR
ncbi:MAG: hypothetical protein HUK25_04065, partial [Treponema sp.]|nr:hypothetical protein [Treponema sp.]